MTHEPRSSRVVLEEDHRNLDRLLDRLLAAVRADDRELEQQTWTRFERALLAHLDVEEMFVFPAIAAAHPEEIVGLRREHDGLRRDLGSLGLAFELHTVRAEVIERLCASLREHAKREESLAYAAAERSLSADIAQAIFRRLESLVGLLDHRARDHHTAGGAA
jgi:hemerythrin-like domain-containing protein